MFLHGLNILSRYSSVENHQRHNSSNSSRVCLCGSSRSTTQSLISRRKMHPTFYSAFPRITGLNSSPSTAHVKTKSSSSPNSIRLSLLPHHSSAPTIYLFSEILHHSFAAKIMYSSSPERTVRPH